MITECFWLEETPTVAPALPGPQWPLSLSATCTCPLNPSRDGGSTLQKTYWPPYIFPSPLLFLLFVRV